MKNPVILVAVDKTFLEQHPHKTVFPVSESGTVETGKLSYRFEF